MQVIFTFYCSRELTYFVDNRPIKLILLFKNIRGSSSIKWLLQSSVSFIQVTSFNVSPQLLRIKLVNKFYKYKALNLTLLASFKQTIINIIISNNKAVVLLQQQKIVITCSKFTVTKKTTLF